jgi:DNA (cytosine-5)-methyltransferase 1
VSEVIAYSLREDAKAGTFSATEVNTARALSALRPSVQSHHAQTFLVDGRGVRRFNILESERLMGWPDNHTQWRADGTENSESKRFQMIRNGVVAPVAEWIATHILIAHRQLDTKEEQG